VAFVEVKAATSTRYGHPAEKVDKRKQEHLTQAAQQYLLKKKLPDVDLRFDVITFVEENLEHFPGAFEATE
jgi:putative endonuclease